MRISIQEYHNLKNESYKLDEQRDNGEITLEEHKIKTEEIIKKIHSAENVLEYEDIETYDKEVKRLIVKLTQKYGMGVSIDDINKQIIHEGEHAQIDMEYDLPPTFCVIYEEASKLYMVQPFCYVKNSKDLTKNWTNYKRAKWTVERLIAPKELSLGDKRELVHLKKAIERSNDLSNEEKKELISMTDKRVKSL